MGKMGVNIRLWDIIEAKLKSNNTRFYLENSYKTSRLFAEKVYNMYLPSYEVSRNTTQSQIL